MKLKKIISTCALMLAIPAVGMAAATYSQAGDIAVGAPYFLTKGQMASYYRMGKEGFVTFACSLEGDGHLGATLYAGKNFVGNAPVALRNGYNGPYTWKLRNLGEDNGNIKVKLVVGKSANVQCKELGYND